MTPVRYLKWFIALAAANAGLALAQMTPPDGGQRRDGSGEQATEPGGPEPDAGSLAQTPSRRGQELDGGVVPADARVPLPRAADGGMPMAEEPPVADRADAGSVPTLPTAHKSEAQQHHRPEATTRASAPPSEYGSSPVADAGLGATALPDQARGWQTQPGVEDEDVVLFVPRAILAIPRYAFEGLLWPIVKTARLIDDWNVVERAERILYFDAKHEFGWRPTLSFRSGFGLAAGAKIFHKSLFGSDEQLELKAQVLGGYGQAYEASLEGDRIGGSRLGLTAVLRYERRAAALFGGIGMTDRAPPASGVGPRDVNVRTYFGHERGLGLVRLGYTSGTVGSLVQPGVTLIGNVRRFSSNDAGWTQVEDVYDRSLISGIEDGVATLEVQANVVVDLRSSAGINPTGLYVETFAGRALAVSSYRYWHYGAEVSHTIDLYKGTRGLTLRAAFEAAQGGDGTIPFTDLPRLGGPDRLRGYMEDEFRDRLAAFASAEYRYPIHRNVSGQLFIDAGHVSDRLSDLYDFSSFRIGYGGGIVVGNDNNVLLRLDLSYGQDFQVFLSSDIARAFNGRSTQL